ncbi:hypothetical protein AK812_SmicGene33729 [Symbiodinium microadriaticum]|uniref:Uncharacterized protein n=1 Tax=Symbiodinium microadriaticum TaxID=2951 RepID=A0A1Q9CQW5_SYMMI|nr:hypothetical protein AK812_SmicGene33729 [Symbiodinium microadriaticum]
MISTRHGEAPPCLFGWAAALLCELRVEKAVLSGAWPELRAALAAADPEETAFEEEGRQVLSALLAGDERHRALTLLESSGWSSLEDVLEALPDGEIGPVLDGHALARAQAFLQQVTVDTVRLQGEVESFTEGPPVLRVWATSTHPTLLLEPLSIWATFAKLEATLCVRGCAAELPGVTCVEGGLVNELLHRHLGTLEDSLGHFPLLPSLENFRTDFEESNFASEIQADVLLCGEPAFICLLFAELNRTVLGYVGNPLGAYLTADDQMQFYSFVAQVPQRTSSLHAALQLVFMAPPIAAQGYWQTGVRLPVVRPVALYARSSQPKQMPSSEDVLITKQVFTFWDFQCLLNAALPSWAWGKWSFRYMTHLKDRSWAAWASYRAAVVLPYDPQTLVFYELYSLSMPLLVPSKELLPLFFARSYGQDRSAAVQRRGWALQRSGAAWGRWHEEASFNELRWWAHLSDVAQLPHLLALASAMSMVFLGRADGASRGLASPGHLRCHERGHRQELAEVNLVLAGSIDTKPAHHHVIREGIRDAVGLRRNGCRCAWLRGRLRLQSSKLYGH